MKVQAALAQKQRGLELLKHKDNELGKQINVQKERVN